MPAKYIKRIDKENGFFHISNKSISGNNIFNDKQDYEIFLGFLKEYLSPITDPNFFQKEFEIRGKKYRGISYQPQNYHNKIDLIVYTLFPNHFHLVLCQLAGGFLEKFMRSLSTRYSMYYNKKYNHQGPLFAGPYKSALIENESSLLYLSNYLHREALESSKYSSYDVYTGKNKLPWLNSNLVLTIFNNSQHSKIKSIENYQKFVENYDLDEKDLKLCECIFLDKEYAHLVRRQPPNKKDNPYSNRKNKSNGSFGYSFFKFSLATSIYILLFSFGFNNVRSTVGSNNTDIVSKYLRIAQTAFKNRQTPVTPEIETQNIDTSLAIPKESVAGIRTETEKDTKLVTVKINDKELSSVNVRENPSFDSKIVASAKDGEIFEYVSLTNSWYQIKLEDGLGYIFSDLVEVVENENI